MPRDLVQFINHIMEQAIKEIKNKYISEGHTVDEADKMTEALTQAAIKELYLAMIKALNDSDLEEVERMEKQEEAVETIKGLFEKRTGKKVEEFFKEFFPIFAETFLQNYNIKI